MKVSSFLLLATVLLSATSCSKKPALSPDEGQRPDASAVQGSAKDSDFGNAHGLRTIYFEYDSSGLGPGAKSDLRHNATILKENKDLAVQIEGHCDERGGIQYNLGLGERRAKAARRHLTALGIQASRITIISYGKERPISLGGQESDHAKNRRGNFVITEE